MLGLGTLNHNSAHRWYLPFFVEVSQDFLNLRFKFFILVFRHTKHNNVRWPLLFVVNWLHCHSYFAWAVEPELPNTSSVRLSSSSSARIARYFALICTLLCTDFSSISTVLCNDFSSCSFLSMSFSWSSIIFSWSLILFCFKSSRSSFCLAAKFNRGYCSSALY